MMTRGIRGATTIDANTPEAIEEATLELLGQLVSKNNIQKDAISHVIFTVSKDLNADFPARYARQKFGWSKVAMMCFHELDVPDALQMCLRVMIVLNCKEDFIPEFVYLKGAADLRR